MPSSSWSCAEGRANLEKENGRGRISPCIDGTGWHAVQRRKRVGIADVARDGTRGGTIFAVNRVKRSSHAIVGPVVTRDRRKQSLADVISHAALHAQRCGHCGICAGGVASRTLSGV